MEFKDKYTSTTEKESGKKILSDDAYAITEYLELLIKKIEQTRDCLIR